MSELGEPGLTFDAAKRRGPHNPPPERPDPRAIAVVLLAPLVFLLLVSGVLGLMGVGGDEVGLMDDESMKQRWKDLKSEYGRVPGSSDGHVHQAVVLAAYRDELKARQALDSYRRALVIDPENESAWLGLAALYPLLRETNELSLAEAALYCTKVAGLFEDRPAPHRILADLYEAAEDWDNAQRSWREVTIRDPQDRAAWLRLGSVRVAGERDIKYIREAFEEAHKLNPKDGDALAALARAQQLKGDYPGALSTIGQINKELGETPSYLVAMARLFEDAGVSQRAAEFLDRVLQSEGDHREALERRAILRYQDLDDPTGALEDLKQLRRRYQPIMNDLERRDLDIHEGTVRFMLGNDDEASALLTKAWERAKDLRALYQLAQVQARRGNGDAVAPLLRKAARSETTPAPVFAVYGDVMTDPTKLRGVVSGFESAIRRRPDYVPAYYALIALLVQARNFADAQDLIDDLYRRDRILMTAMPPDRDYFDPIGLSKRLEPIADTLHEFEERDTAGDSSLRLRAMWAHDSGDTKASTDAAMRIMKRSSVPERAYQAASLAWLGGRDRSARDACDEGTRRKTYLLLRYPCGRLREQRGDIDGALQSYEEMKGQTELDYLAAHGLARVHHLRKTRALEAGGEGAESSAAAAGEAARRAYQVLLESKPDFLPARRDLLLLSLGEPASEERP